MRQLIHGFCPLKKLNLTFGPLREKIGREYSFKRKENFVFVLRKNNVVRAFQWHPHSSKYAVAFKNDIVKIYSNNQPHVVLKHHSQQNITCLAWK